MAQQTEIALGVGARSEKGRREDNQDKMTAFSTALGTFYIVADGMGGHRGGAEASHSVLEGYRKHLRAFPEAADFADVVQHATTLTNAEIFAAGRSGDPSVHGMGSTVVMAMLRTVPGGAAGTGTSGMELLTAHIGDSRAYLLRGATLTRLTRDHSAVQRMVDENLISAEAAKTHPDLNVLTRALGKQAEIAIEVGARVPLYPGDTVLLCTDGLWGHVSDEQMAYELSADRSASETADALVQMALDNGSDDRGSRSRAGGKSTSEPGADRAGGAAGPRRDPGLYRSRGRAGGAGGGERTAHAQARPSRRLPAAGGCLCRSCRWRKPLLERVSEDPAGKDTDRSRSGAELRRDSPLRFQGRCEEPVPGRSGAAAAHAEAEETGEREAIESACRAAAGTD
jgi:protein phosphatase